MATFTKRNLSQSSNGRNIPIEQIVSPGTLIHTAVSGTDDWDEIYIYACNLDTVNRTLTIEWGETASLYAEDDILDVELEPDKGLYLVIPGLLLQNSLTVRAYATAIDVINVNGYVNRIEA